MIAPRQNRVINSYGVGADQFCSRVMTTNEYGCPYATVDTELESYRFLIGSTPITDHSIQCSYGGAQQLAEFQKFFRAMGADINLPNMWMDKTGLDGSNCWFDGFKYYYGLICQNFNLEMVESDDVFTGQFANSFSDITLETRWVNTSTQALASLTGSEKLDLTIFLQFNALLTVTPTALLIES
jgi:hypothetical protein